MGIPWPWKKIGKIALSAGSVASSFTGIGWLGLAVKGGNILGGVLLGDESPSDAGMKAFEALVQYASDLESDDTMHNGTRGDLLNAKIEQFAGTAEVKDRHIGLVSMVVLATVHGEMSIEEAAALLNVDG